MEVVSLTFDIEEKFNIELPFNANLDIKSKTVADHRQCRARAVPSMGFKVGSRGGRPRRPGDRHAARRRRRAAHAEGAERKAFTARTFSQPSADFVKRLEDRPDTAGSRAI